MLFNSIDFAVFIPIVFILYWFVCHRNLRLQNILIVISSYVFYGWWDWRFLSLIIISSSVDYTVGRLFLVERSDLRRKLILALSLAANLGLLGVFKYFNFFADSFVDAFTLFGKHLEPTHLKFILPVGISFYTFQTLSYTIDIYRRKTAPTRDFIAFFAFVSFFPQLVAGPIERASNLIPQFLRKRTFDSNRATDGMRQILWGFFKKLVIADNCGIYVERIFTDYQEMSGLTLVLGSILFGLQIYGDFSGYSDIAIGTARLFGFRLMRNFAFPYFSRDIAEFWRRWHISLSTWFRDYVYIPLGGSRGRRITQVRNVFVIFIVSGFWHGANWTFIFWGLLNALYFIPLLLLSKNRKYLDNVAQGRIFPSGREFLQVTGTFLLVSLSWVFFRADNLAHAFDYLFRMQGWIFVRPLEAFHIISPPVLWCIIFMISFEWIQRDKEHALVIRHFPVWARWILYLAIAFTIFMFGNFSKTEFIYFAF